MSFLPALTSFLTRNGFVPGPSWALAPCSVPLLNLLWEPDRGQELQQTDGAAPQASLSHSCSPVNHGGLCVPRAHAPGCQTWDASALLARDGKSPSSGIQGGVEEKGKQAQSGPAWRRALTSLEDAQCMGMDGPRRTAYTFRDLGSSIPLSLAARPGPSCRRRAAVPKGTGSPQPPARTRAAAPRRQCSASPSHLQE